MSCCEFVVCLGIVCILLDCWLFSLIWFAALPGVLCWVVCLCRVYCVCCWLLGCYGGLFVSIDYLGVLVVLNCYFVV